MAYIIIKVTYPNKIEADETINFLLKNRLISSANLFPIKSTSAWSGKIVEVDEIIVLFKTIKENWIRVRDEIKNTHPYKVPCITKINAEANKEYEDWIIEMTK